LGTRVNPDTIGYVWTGEYDLNTLRVDGEIFESATKKLRIRNYPYTCGQGLSCVDFFQIRMIFVVSMDTQMHGDPLGRRISPIYRAFSHEVMKFLNPKLTSHQSYTHQAEEKPAHFGFLKLWRCLTRSRATIVFVEK